MPADVDEGWDREGLQDLRLRSNRPQQGRNQDAAAGGVSVFEFS